MKSCRGGPATPIIFLAGATKEFLQRLKRPARLPQHIAFIAFYQALADRLTKARLVRSNKISGNADNILSRSAKVFSKPGTFPSRSAKVSSKPDNLPKRLNWMASFLAIRKGKRPLACAGRGA